MTKIISLTVSKKYLPYLELMRLRKKKSLNDEIGKAIRHYVSSDKQIILPKDLRNMEKLNNEDILELMNELQELSTEVFEEWKKRK